jgi:hypothetical protein
VDVERRRGCEMNDQLLASLRKLCPARVVVFDHGDDKREVAVPTRRKKWSQVVEAIEARPWSRVECLDKSGAVLGYIEQDDAPTELETIGVGGGKVAETKAMLELMLRAQDMALKYQDKDRATLMQSVRDILEVNTAATRELVGLMRMQRDTAADIAAMRAGAAAAEGKEDGDWDKLLKVLEDSPKLMTTLGPLVGMVMQMGRSLKPAPPPRKPAPPAAPPAPAAGEKGA